MDIRDYLTMLDSNNPMRSLYRCIDQDQGVAWKCQEHTHQHLDQETLGSLREFVKHHGGFVDMQQATIKVELKSVTAALRFCSLLESVQHAFDISIKLGWKATQSFAEGLCLEIAKTNAMVLEIDGFNLDTHPEFQVQYRGDFFADKIIGHSNIKFVRLLNHPTSSEHSLFIGQYQLKHRVLATHSVYNWMELLDDLVKFGNTVSGTASATESKMAADEDWHGIFNLKDGAFVDIRTCDLSSLNTKPLMASVRRLTVDLSEKTCDQKVYRMLARIPRLQELNIWTSGRNVVHQAEHIADFVLSTQTPFKSLWLIAF
ncbi:hypothetical protein MVEG_01306 [Podila verticillata NRRL 6337]|nr:hypothetical protein MVEG_01306 [Podila verticillata NRRL 6337]